MYILLVEDDIELSREIKELLAKEGYTVELASTQNQAISQGLQIHTLDLVLLDITLAQGNGFAVCSSIKEKRPDVPIIFLTASDDEFNTVTGLSLGADDYIAKPFRPRELLARIAAVLRRTSKRLTTITFGNLVIHPESATVTKFNQQVQLSSIEYKLLLLFASHAGSIVTKEMIRQSLWENEYAHIEDNTLSVYIKRLREKIEDDMQNPRYIKTIRGLGYRSMGDTDA